MKIHHYDEVLRSLNPFVDKPVIIELFNCPEYFFLHNRR